MEFRERVTLALGDKTIVGDGHTLFSPEYYAPHFTESELAEAGLIETHKSDGTPKGTIFASDGSIVPELKAVYNLDFLYWVHGKLGITAYPQAMGRGSQAQELVAMIHHVVAVDA